MLLYLVAAALVLSDQFTKFLILRGFTYGESVPVLKNIFHLTLVQNTGIAFGLFQEKPFLLTGLITFCIVLLAVFSFKMIQRSLLERIAYGLILGGAVGNLIDRFRFGWVVDFLDFRIWPVFNVADSAITVGVVFFAWKILFSYEKQGKN